MKIDNKMFFSFFEDLRHCANNHIDLYKTQEILIERYRKINPSWIVSSCSKFYRMKAKLKLS